MKVLLAGGAGYIGSHTALCLLEKGYDVVVMDNLLNASPEALRRVEQLTGKKAPLEVGDCCDVQRTRAVFEGGGRIGGQAAVLLSEQSDRHHDPVPGNEGI